MPPSWLTSLERVSRVAHRFSVQEIREPDEHPFETRDVHPALPDDVKRLFDNGHFPQATFEAFKFVDAEVQRLSGLSLTGKSLMMQAFQEIGPVVSLADVSTVTGKNIQEGYKFIFAGSMISIRNPRGHEHSMRDDMNTCLDHLTLASHLLRVLEDGGHTIGSA